MKEHQSFFESVKSALKGLGYAFEERNFRIQVIIGVIVLIFGFVFSLSVLERVIVFILVGLVLVMEALNSGFERFIDFHVKTNEPEIARVKDIFAGAVLVTSFVALIVGIVIFGRHLF